MNPIKFLILLLLVLIQIKHINSNRKLSEANTTIILTSVSETPNITFSSGDLLIWPENCKLSVKNGNNELGSNRDYILISTSNEINISVDERDSNSTNGECRYHYVNLDSTNTIYLTDTGMFKFTQYSNLNLIFNIEGETNPIYYLYLNKLGKGDLKFNLQSYNYSQTFNIPDFDPNTLFYLNRNNSFKYCSNKESYICTINLKITGNNIPFNILIRNGNENNYATYLKPNEMILGVAESFNPLYFFTEIPVQSEGEIFINYKKGGKIVYSNIQNKGSKGLISKTSQTYLGNFDYYNKKLTFNSSSCNNESGCELFIWIFVNDYEFDIADGFSIFLKYTDNNKKSVNILFNEFVYGTLINENENVLYNINITSSTSELNFIFENDNCLLTISNSENENIKYICYSEYCEISVTISENEILTFNINSQIKNSFYSLKINYPSLGQVITSERNEYYYINDTQIPCYFIIPLREYENITHISFYLFNYDYPKSFKPNLSISQSNITSLNFDDLTYSNEDQQNYYTYIINNNDKYIILKLHH